jgi:signal transduction histidine kinase
MDPRHPSPVAIAELLTRQRLFERLARIQRSISHRAPLQEVFDAIVSGASELLGDEVVGLRLIDDRDPSHCVLAASHGLSERHARELERTPVGMGAGGRAIREGHLVVIEDYEQAPDAFRNLARDGLRAAMAAPIRDSGVIMGSLTVASYREGRRFSAGEREALVAFSDHAGLALTDAKMVEAMREAQRARELFNAMVSHELKTPLTVITGTLQTLSRHHHSLSPDMRESLIASAEQRARELRRMIDRLLEGARAELAGATWEILLTELVAEAIQGFDKAGRVAVGHVPPVIVTIDSIAARELIGILLENAVSHSPPDSPVAVEAAADQDTVSISVCNRGRLPEDLDPASLFAPFRRGARARSSGVGLGLYVAHRLAQSIHGTIDVSSTADSVTFTLRLPVGGPASTLLATAREGVST